MFARAAEPRPQRSAGYEGGSPAWLGRSNTNSDFRRSRFARGADGRLYTFAVDGKQLPLFTTISRVRRDDRQIEGYQRPEVLAHVSAIRSYIESAEPMIPNAIVVAFDTRVRFEPASAETDVSYVTPGVLVIPVDEDLADEDKPGWIVDGQQRSAAVREADIRSFPLCVTAFITASRGGAASAVHPRQLYEAAPEGPHLRTAADDGGAAAAGTDAKAVSERCSSNV